MALLGNRRRAMITLNLGDSGVPVPFQIDSESECCVLPRHEYVRVTGDIASKTEASENCHSDVQRNTRESAESV